MATRILFFGKLKDPAGGAEREVTLPDGVSDDASLIDWLCDGDEILRAALCGGGVRLCVNQTIAAPGAAFDAPEEIAFLPAFSGG